VRVDARVSERPCRYCGQRTPRDACGDCMCELAERARLSRLETRARPVVLALSIEDRLALDELAREWGYLWAMRLWMALAVGTGAWHDRGRGSTGWTATTWLSSRRARGGHP